MIRKDERTCGTAKAKLELLFDAGTFVELGAYTKRSTAEEELESVVCGYGAVAGTLAFAFVQDSGRTKGAFGERHAKKIEGLYALAVKNGAPVIGVFDSAGVVIHDGASALAAYGKFMKTVADASGIVPQIAVIDGICGGSAAVVASMFDFVVTVKGHSELYMNAPFVLNTDRVAEAGENGLASFEADTVEAAYAFAKELTELLPQNNADGSFVNTADDLNRTLGLDLASYTAEALCRELADGGRFLRLYAGYTDKAVFGLCPIGGVLTGVIASEPSKKGILDAATARAATKLIGFCDAFGIPLVTLVNSEGTEVSAEAERAAYAAELSRLAMAYATSDNAKLTVVVGRAYGAAFALLGSKALGADLVYAVEDAVISVLSPEASVAFVWNDRVKETSREELEDEWRKTRASAEEAAKAGEIDDIIEAAELRKRICAGLMMLSSKADGTPTRRHAVMPL